MFKYLKILFCKKIKEKDFFDERYGFMLKYGMTSKESYEETKTHYYKYRHHLHQYPQASK